MHNAVLYRHLRTLRQCYTTGQFEALSMFLAEDCVFETQWMLEPRVGKLPVLAYFMKKGILMRDSNSCPHGIIVEVQHPYRKLALLLRQRLNDKTNDVIVDIQIDEEDKISRIDVCMPQFFQYIPYFDEE